MSDQFGRHFWLLVWLLGCSPTVVVSPPWLTAPRYHASYGRHHSRSSSSSPMQLRDFTPAPIVTRYGLRLIAWFASISSCWRLFLRWSPHWAGRSQLAFWRQHSSDQ